MNALAPIPASEARLPAAYEQAKVYFVSDTRRVKIGTSRDLTPNARTLLALEALVMKSRPKGEAA